MWVNSLPWRGIALSVAVAGAMYGVYQWGYGSGHSSAERDGNAALSQQKSRFDEYRRVQAEQENAALRAWSVRYQAQVAAGHQAEADYLSQVAQLENQNQQLKEKIDDVTQRWIDEKGKSYPIKCVFTRGFVQQYNAALGFEDATTNAGHTDRSTSATSGAGTTSRQPEAADGRLRDSGISQQDILANIIDNARQCRVWRSQINGLLDYTEGLQK